MPLEDLDIHVTGVEATVRDTVHRFAAQVLRPAGEALDKLSPEAVIDADSVLWSVLSQYRELGLGRPDGDLSAEEQARLSYITSEELGWGDAGLAIAMGVSGFPRMVALQSGNPELVDMVKDNLTGCWAITEPDHGSDTLDFHGEVRHEGTSHGRPNVIARAHGDDFVLSGQKSSWVSCGTIAQAAALFCSVDMGVSELQKAVFVVPLDVDGVSRGKPLDKIGQRALNQGEIFFDEVRIPRSFMAIPPEGYDAAAGLVLTNANTGMGTLFAGLARAALELAIDYAKERKQGGVPIIQHQSVRSRLFEMFRKFEAARSLNRDVVLSNALNQPRLEYAIASKVTSTQTAFEVASEALQIFGGNGTSREYPIEKIFRDARASMIEDGCNYVLGMLAGTRL
ncbi:MAG: acyl-CoA dehydrogenase family protein [Pseudomonadales bacterium]|jgi:alkylation response protein AidB-like acyl-CoA dehydrogenase|nr:acyl-CoA dehydrogenase family protein [Pseudomonadales bacterium]MDP6472317.1 acyl-CoA dehydrogenase family protein [Pseudomonadales bacterium]MDP6828113.1 acyl-CoA dehydrogenase family protein [Pseudomonadales bacterium]MDP6971811.1 acyl-CoA dehydrogenase family protein [Pseudomonadales bacterium]|tara:strand:- start:2193 stop:3383 length:1191 start_codon:yes stop_codon:yes gene_type:complete